MRVRNAENLEHALQRAVFARATVQDVECGVGLGPLNVAPMSRLTSARLTRYPVRSSASAQALERKDTSRSATSPHQDRNVLHCLSVPQPA